MKVELFWYSNKANSAIGRLNKLLLNNNLSHPFRGTGGMKYYSTNKNSDQVSFKEATIRGQAPDKGLYFPETIPQVDKSLIDEMEKLSNEEIAFHVIKP